MKPYGVPRIKDVESPDVSDIQTYGLKSSIGRVAGKGGDIKGYQKPKQKAYSRRVWKKKARNISDKIVFEDTKNENN